MANGDEISFDNIGGGSGTGNEISFGGVADQPSAGTFPQAIKKGIKNIPATYWQDVVEPLGQLVAHPIKTGEGLYHMARGGALAAEDVYRQKMGLPAAPTDQDAENVKNLVMQNYGSWENYKRYLAEHPTQALSDISMLLGVGGSGIPAALRMAGAGEKIANAAEITLKYGAKVTNPLTPITEPISTATGALASRAGPRVLSETERAQQELAASGQPVDVPRYMSGTVARTAAVPLAKAPLAGIPIQRAADVIPEQIGKNIEEIAAQSSGQLAPGDVGAAIGQPLTAAAEAEAKAARVRAQISHDQAVATWERQQQEREGAVRGQEASTSAAADRQFGTIHPTQAAEQTIADVQRAHAADEAANDARWEQVNQLNAPVSRRAFEGLSDRVEQGVANSGVTLGAQTTPNAMRMMDELRKLTRTPERPGAPADLSGINPRMQQALLKAYGSADKIPDDVVAQFGGKPKELTIPATEPNYRLMGEHAPAPGDVHVTAQGIDALRKRMVQMANNAERGSEDSRAANAVKREFENWQADAFQNHALGGDSNAAATIRNAVNGHRQFMEKYGYNYYRLPQGMNRTAASELNQIATGNAGSTDVAKKLVGGSPGQVEVAHPLFKRIEGVVQDPAALRQRMRGAYWRGLDVGTPENIANKIGKLQQSPMGQELFSPAEHAQMQQVGQIRQSVKTALEQAQSAAGPKPKKQAIAPGPAQETAKLFTGNRSNEQIYRALDNAFKTGPTAKFEEGRDAWGRLPAAAKDEFRGAWLRGLGKDAAGNFTLDRFVSDWTDYSDKAKQLMMVNDPAHLRNLNNFHTIASDLKDAVKKYGNPSGTAAASSWMKLLSAAVKTGVAIGTGTVTLHNPIMILIAGISAAGTYGLSKLISSPRGVQTMNRWNTLAKAYNRVPTAGKLNALSAMSRDIQNQATGP